MLFIYFAHNNDYTIYIEWLTQRSLCRYKNFPLLLLLMSRICKVRSDVKSEFSGFEENLSLPFFPSTSFASLIQWLPPIDFLDKQVPGEYSIGN